MQAGIGGFPAIVEEEPVEVAPGVTGRSVDNKENDVGSADN